MVRAPRGRVGKPYDRPRASDDKWVHDRAPVDVPKAVAKASSVPQPQSLQGTRLVVSNLHYEVTAKDLISIFGRVGTLVREPDIKYDRSGRSTGVAILHFETPEEATKARNAFNGKNARGQAMEIAIDTRPARNKSSKALMNRISKPPLIERLASDSASAFAISGKADASRVRTNGGPIRTRGGRRGGRVAGGRFRKEPKTAEDLDKELDSFMADDSSKPAGSASAPIPAAAAAPAPTGDADVEMET